MGVYGGVWVGFGVRSAGVDCGMDESSPNDRHPRSLNPNDKHPDANLDPKDARRLDSPDQRVAERERLLYGAWAELLGWLREYASRREGVKFIKQADFPDYIYRMERPYDLPTTVMSASLSSPGEEPVLLVSVSPRHTVFKEVTLHPFESHVYRKLSYDPAQGALVEGKRPFTRAMLETLADDLFAQHA